MYRLLLLIVSLVFSSLVGAVTFDEQMRTLPLGQSMYVFEDVRGDASIDDIASPAVQGSFRLHDKPVLNAGYSRSVFWLRLDLHYLPRQAQGGRNWLLELAYPPLDHLELYLPDEAGGFALAQRTGDSLPFVTRQIRQHNYLFELNLEPNQNKRIYLRLESQGSIQAPLTLWAPNAYLEEQPARIYVLGIIYGVLLLMLVYNLFIFLSVRDTSYLYYILYIASFGLYQVSVNGAGIEYFWPDNVDNQFGADGRIQGATLKSDGSTIDYNGIGTMSKSKNNGVDPQDLINRYGADTARLYTMFTSPPEDTLLWSDAGVDGSARFLKRLWSLAFTWSDKAAAAGKAGGKIDASTLSEPLKRLRREVHGALKQIDFDIGRIQYNTVVSGAMKMLNALDSMPKDDPSAPVVMREGLSILLRALNPVVPHVTHVLWQDLGMEAAWGDLLDASWPQVDAAALQSDVLELVLQINGKHRGSVSVPATASKDEIEQLAVASDITQKFAEGRPPKKVVVVPGRLVNVVL